MIIKPRLRFGIVTTEQGLPHSSGSIYSVLPCFMFLGLHDTAECSTCITQNQNKQQTRWHDSSFGESWHSCHVDGLLLPISIPRWWYQQPWQANRWRGRLIVQKALLYMLVIGIPPRTVDVVPARHCRWHVLSYYSLFSFRLTFLPRRCCEGVHSTGCGNVLEAWRCSRSSVSQSIPVQSFCPSG